MAVSTALTAARRRGGRAVARLTRRARHRARGGPRPWPVMLGALALGGAGMWLATRMPVGGLGWAATTLASVPVASYGLTTTMLRVGEWGEGPRPGKWRWRR